MRLEGKCHKMIPRLSIPLALLLSIAFVSGSVIRQDSDEVSSNRGNKKIIDGDIMLTGDQVKALSATGKRAKRQITKIWKKWPNNVVYYYFSDEFTTLKRQLIQNAMSFISSQTCVSFVESKTAQNRIRFENTGGCASYIGMNGGEQSLWFGQGCEIFGTAVHELMHTLGIFHTHSRYDRDDFLLVNLTGVPENMLGNLEKESSQDTYNAVPFEYGSTMQYRYNTWGTGTLDPKQTIYQKTMGNRKVSFYDVVNINSRYACKCASELPCKNGGYANPANCAVCICPSGFGGQYCDGFPENARVLTASSEWKGYWVSFGYNKEVLTTNYYYAYLIITAPVGKTIEVKIVEMSNFECAYGCNYNGIELKYMGDPRIMNPLMCCNDDPRFNQVITSKQNPTPIVLHQRYGASKIVLNYRYVDTPMNRMSKNTNGYDNYQYNV